MFRVMIRLLLSVALFASPVFAQNSAQNSAPNSAQNSARNSGGDPLAAAGCGANEVHFNVKTDKKQHPTAQPEAGKALVYVIGDTSLDHVAVHIGTPPTRFGVDGTWVGANGYRSYFFFPVDPGEHRLCTNMQTRVQRQVKSTTAATSFTAEAGKSYYFRTRTPVAPVAGEEIKLVPVDPAEAQVLLAAAAFSTFSLQK